MPHPRSPLAILKEGRIDSARRSAEALFKASSQEQKDVVSGLFDHIGALGLEIRDLTSARLDPRVVRNEIFKLADVEPHVPNWLLKPGSTRSKSPGTPTLFASDWHWGEQVSSTQLHGVNTFNLKVAHTRAKLLIERTIHLLKNHMTNPVYPGIVFALGGDMLSGDIHEELRETNEVQSFVALLDLYGVLCECIAALAGAFGAVYVPCVAGNHGRQSRKPRHKLRAETNYDWLLYQMLELRFKDDKRITFNVPSSSDAAWNVYGYQYLMTHGDQFRGGDGVIGAVGPIIRGDHRKRTRNGQIGRPYDTMLLGHFHTYLHMGRVIVNGSLKGYDEYAYDNNFAFEHPQQALWVTHPDHGITFALPVILEDPIKKQGSRQWASTA